VYVSGEGNDLVKLFKHKPRQLNKELTEQIGGQTDKVYLTPQGGLRVIVQNQTQKSKLLNDKSVTMTNLMNAI